MVEQKLDHLQAVVTADGLVKRPMSPRCYPVRIGAVFQHQIETFEIMPIALRSSSVLMLCMFTLPLSSRIFSTVLSRGSMTWFFANFGQLSNMTSCASARRKGAVRITSGGWLWSRG